MIRTALRLLLALAYGFAGYKHITAPTGFLAITPPWVPFPEAVVYWTGIAEIAGAIGLLVPRLMVAAGVGLALYALCVWPANIYHALYDIPVGGSHQSWWYHGPRLTLQPLIIWWALWASHAIDWPFGRQD
jgi:uncharacterized membrane protein